MNNPISNLQRIIDEGKTKVPNVLSEIDREYTSRKDFYIQHGILNVLFPENQMKIHLSPSVIQENETYDYNTTSHSESQIYSHYGIPQTYGRRLLEKKLPDLLEYNFNRINETFARQNESILMRAIDGKIKGWLSPSFKMMDARPMIFAFAKSCIHEGMVPIQGYNTDSQMTIRYAYPEMIKPANMNEYESYIFGASISTSDYGGAALSIKIYIVRLICLNGMIGNMLWRKVHIGSRFNNTSDMTFLSNKTIRMDALTMESAVADSIRLIKTNKELVGKKIDDAFTKNPTHATWAEIQNKTNKETLEKIKTVYEMSTEIEQLPKEKSMWRLANAISLVSQSTENLDDKIDLENLSMRIIN